MTSLLRGDYKQSEYGRVILPLTVIRRLDCVLERTKADVLAKHTEVSGTINNVAPVLRRVCDSACGTGGMLSVAEDPCASSTPAPP